MKRRMKMLVIALAVCLGCFALAGCSGGGSTGSGSAASGAGSESSAVVSSVTEKSPSDVVRDTFDQGGGMNSFIEKSMMNAMYKSIESSTGGAKLTKTQKNVLSKLVKKVLKYDFTVGSEKIKGNKATVKVKFKTYDFSKLMDKSIDAVSSQAYAQAAQGKTITEKKVTAMLFTEMDKQLDKITKKSRTASVTIKLTKNSSGKWEVDSLGKDAQNALLGGLSESKYLS